MADKIDANASTAEVDALRELAGRFDKLILEDTNPPASIMKWSIRLPPARPLLLRTDFTPYPQR
ncbi:hypothetical protein GOL41_31450 [Sinorhizobium medicae]|nr:hypothetical protein [Sinorhizobium medicae]MDX1219747.1 hypothetical protein [Sinorhizobium medicae]